MQLLPSPHQPVQQLYRLFDAAGQLLYIGISSNVHARFATHRGDKAWWIDVARAEVEDFPDRASASTAEKRAIKSERPIHNHVHNTSRPASPSSQAQEVDPEMLAVEQEAAKAFAQLEVVEAAGGDMRGALLHAVAAQGAVYQARRARAEMHRKELHKAIVDAAPVMAQNELAKLSGLSRTAVHSIINRPAVAPQH